jgi:hypothetical protein
VGIASRTNNDTLVIDSSKTWNAAGSDVKLYIFPDAGLGFNVQAMASGSDGTIPAGTYEFAQTFIYDGVQESLPTVMTGLTTVLLIKDLRYLLQHHMDMMKELLVVEYTLEILPQRESFNY